MLAKPLLGLCLAVSAGELGEVKQHKPPDSNPQSALISCVSLVNYLTFLGLGFYLFTKGEILFFLSCLVLGCAGPKATLLAASQEWGPWIPNFPILSREVRNLPIVLCGQQTKLIFRAYSDKGILAVNKLCS